MVNNTDFLTLDDLTDILFNSIVLDKDDYMVLIFVHLQSMENKQRKY